MWVLVCLTSVWTVGCPAPIPYQPGEHVVHTLGVPQAQQRLEAVLARSINPRIIAIDVTEELLRYRYPLSYLMGTPEGSTTAERRVVFREVDRVDVFDNHVVLVRGSEDKILAQLVFTNAEDAKIFADLVYSFRAYRSSASH